MSRWFRVYDDLVDDPKVQQLSPKNFRALVNLWCITSKNNGRPSTANDLAFKLRMKPSEAAKVLADLQAAGLIDATDEGFTPHNWASRQFKSDTSNERVQRFRERERNVTGNVISAVTVTPPDTETESESDKKEAQAPPLPSDNSSVELKARSKKPKKPQQPKTRLPENWSVSDADVAYAGDQGLDGAQIGFQEKAFKAHWHDPDTKNAEKVSWSSAWQKWILRSISFQNGDVQKLPRDHAPARAAASAAASALAGQIFVKVDSEPWEAWQIYSRATRGIGLNSSIPRTDPSTGLRVNGQWFDSEYPPPLPAETISAFPAPAAPLRSAARLSL